MKVVHIFMCCTPVLVFYKQADLHCMYSLIVSRSGVSFFFVAVRVRFVFQWSVVEGRRGSTPDNAAASEGGLVCSLYGLRF
jgi:hypothetical protein